MAKASLNMLTRTAASSLAERGIFMTSVDTGWVTNENPYAMTEAMRANLQFEPPLDEIDGAARVLDPIFSAEEKPLHGLFLKDYKPTTW
jgi:NAD(P)-dependent dehydrogenase (short-subunit alcohol dehydrogenase family)